MKLKCPANHEQDALGYFLAGGYCPHCATFDERRFKDAWHYPYFLVLSFIRRFTWRDYRATDGDPVLAMVASEIWLHNIGRMLARNMALDTKALHSDAERRRLMPKCNAYSLSQALGLPPQTVRRKVNTLIERGWVERLERGELLITAAGEAAFEPSFNLETMRDFISTARALFEALDLPLAPALSETGNPARRSRR